MEELGAADMAMAVSLSVHILSQYPVVTWGTDEQRPAGCRRCSPARRSGAFALTEPHAGSDAAAIRTRAERVGGRCADAYRLTGTKIWISNAPEADRYLVFATVDPALGAKGITAFLVEKGTPGFRFGAHERKMGIRAARPRSWCSRAARCPAANRLGEEGDGLPDRAVGAGRGPDLDRRRVRRDGARRRWRRRPGISASARAFGGPLSEQQGLRFMLAEMARDVAAARALTREAAAAKDRGEPPGRGLVTGQVDGVRRRDAGRDRRRPAVRRERATRARPASSA